MVQYLQTFCGTWLQIVHTKRYVVTDVFIEHVWHIQKKTAFEAEITEHIATCMLLVGICWATNSVVPFIFLSADWLYLQEQR